MQGKTRKELITDSHILSACHGGYKLYPTAWLTLRNIFGFLDLDTFVLLYSSFYNATTTLLNFAFPDNKITQKLPTQQGCVRFY